MKRTKLAASFLLVATLFLTGCVTKKEFVNLQTDYNKLKDEKSALDKSYQDAQIQLAEYRTQSKSLEDRLSEARKNNQELLSLYLQTQFSLNIKHHPQFHIFHNYYHILSLYSVLSDS